MAVVRICVLVFITLFHRKLLVFSKVVERSQLDSISTTFPQEFIELLESRLDVKVRNLNRQIQDLAGQSEHSRNEAMIELTWQIANLQASVNHLSDKIDNICNVQTNIPPTATHTTTPTSPSVNAAPSEGDIRLVNGTALAGRVEIYHSRLWGTVCDDNFDVTDASIVCTQLGFSGGGVRLIYGPGNGPIWIDGLRCSGSENRLADCPFNGWNIEDCVHSEDAGVACDPASFGPTPTPVEGDVRLVNGEPYEGLLEIYHNNEWGTVCKDNFTAGATVVCRQLGLSGGRADYEKFPRGTGQIWMDQVRCHGSETRLADCSFSGWGSHHCGHGLDIDIFCDPPVGTSP